MCKKLFSSILLVITITGCGEGYRLTLEHQVYEALFNELINDANKVVLIGNTTYPILSHRFTKEKFLKNNAEFRDIVPLLTELIESEESRVSIDWKPVMVNGQFLDLPEGQVEYKEQLRFKEIYGTGSYYRVSQVFVDRKTNDAIVAISNNCGPICGFGGVAHFKKIGSTWTMVKYAGIWVS
jgi:hypothetical protein